MITEDDNEQVKYLYYFSNNSQLQRAFAVCDGEKIELFNRSKELEVLLDEYDKIVKVNIA